MTRAGCQWLVIAVMLVAVNWLAIWTYEQISAKYDHQTETVIAELKTWEGFRAHIYRDTNNVLTVGYGTDLEAGITVEEADWLLRHRLAEKTACLEKSLPNFSAYSVDVRGVLMAMAYQLGCHGVTEFTDMIAALDAGDVFKARTAALDSEWARETPQRAKAVTEILTAD